MCPSYRVTRDERDVTRGRANSLRLAITGQLGPDALTSDEMAETLKLCVSCKGCRRECPTGVDMARMKIEVQAARAEKHGLSLHDRLVGYLPRYAPYAAKLPWLLNLRDMLPGAAKLSEAIAGFSAARAAAVARDISATSRRIPLQAMPCLRRMRVDSPQAGERSERSCCSPTPSTAISSARISMPRSRCCNAGGYRVHVAKPADGSSRPLCCGRTFLSVGKVDEARAEAERTLAALAPFVVARRAGGRPGAELPAQLPRRGAGDGEGRGRQRSSPSTR